MAVMEGSQQRHGGISTVEVSGPLCTQEELSTLHSQLASQRLEVRASAAQFVLGLAREVPAKDYGLFMAIMQSVVDALERLVLCAAAQEELLETLLKALTSAALAAPLLFKETCFVRIWPLLLQISSIPDFVDDDVRHLAMQAAMSLALGLMEDFCTADGQALLEEMVTVNVEWLLEVDLDVNRWNAQGEVDDGDDKLDEDTPKIAEDNLCSLAEKCSQLRAKDTEATQLEAAFLPVIFKVLNTFLHLPKSTWRHSRAAAVALSRVTAHVVEEAWLLRSVQLVESQLGHAHPRVRHAALQATNELVRWHGEYMQANHLEVLLRIVLATLSDHSSRVAASAASTLATVIAGLSVGALQPHAEVVIKAALAHLSTGNNHALQENCLSCLAAIAHVSEELLVSCLRDNCESNGQWCTGFRELEIFSKHLLHRRHESDLPRPMKRRRYEESAEISGSYYLSAA